MGHNCWVRATAPASLMFFGEHSVLHFGPAVVAAINGYLIVEVERRSDDEIEIISDLGRESSTIKNLQFSSTFRFVSEVFKALQSHVTSGFTCRITSHFPSTMGLGSSAAVTVATIGAIKSLFEFECDIHATALQVVRKVQGMGSGADLAASLLGGVVAYQAIPEVRFRRMSDFVDIVVAFSGYKTPTSEVIRYVQDREKRDPQLITDILQLQKACAEQAVEAIEKNDLSRIGYLANMSQGVMEALGVSDQTLSEIAWKLRDEKGIFGSKISGSGLGDCVIGFGKCSYREGLLPYTISPTGLVVEAG